MKTDKTDKNDDEMVGHEEEDLAQEVHELKADESSEESNIDFSGKVSKNLKRDEWYRVEKMP